MTIIEARKLLKNNADNLTDEEVGQLIIELRPLATAMVYKVLKIDYKYENEECDYSS